MITPRAKQVHLTVWEHTQTFILQLPMLVLHTSPCSFIPVVLHAFCFTSKFGLNYLHIIHTVIKIKNFCVVSWWSGNNSNLSNIGRLCFSTCQLEIIWPWGECEATSVFHLMLVLCFCSNVYVGLMFLPWENNQISHQVLLKGNMDALGCVVLNHFNLVQYMLYTASRSCKSDELHSRTFAIRLVLIISAEPLTDECLV